VAEQLAAVADTSGAEKWVVVVDMKMVPWGHYSKTG
jgi:hypothetical protein